MDAFISFSLDVLQFHSQMLFCLFIVIFFVHFLFLKKHIYSLLDPLFIFLVFNTFSLITVFFVSFYKDEFLYFYDLLIFNICFFLPAFLIKPINFELYKINFQTLVSPNGYFFYKLMAFVFIFTAILLWAVRGIPLLSENPTDAKVNFYSAGFGVVRYVHFIIPSYLFFVGVLMFLISWNDHKSHRFNNFRKWFVGGVLIFVFVFFIISGSKSSILPLLFCLAFLNQCFSDQTSYKIINAILFFLVIVFVFFVLIVIYFSGINENNDLMESLLSALSIRLLASGDVFYFWYEFNLHENTNLKFGLLDYLLSPLVTMLGFLSHGYPLGSIIMNEATGYPLSSFGPNGQLPVVLDIAWGELKYIGAFLFGFLVFYIRRKSYYIIRKYGVGGGLLFTLVQFSPFVIYTDILILANTIYAFLILFVPIYIVFNLIKSSFRY